MWFREEAHADLGHLISSEGIQPLPKKLGSIRNIPASKNSKEVKQFLSLARYYCNFVPRFSDLLRSLTWLTHKDVIFEWTKECQAIFKLLKESLCKQHIPKYPDPERLYVLFMDASKYGWAGVWLNHTLTAMTHQPSPALPKLMSWMYPAQTKLMEHLDDLPSSCLCKWSFQRKPDE